MLCCVVKSEYGSRASGGRDPPAGETMLWLYTNIYPGFVLQIVFLPLSNDRIELHTNRHLL